MPFALAQTTAVAVRSVPGRAARVWSEAYECLVTIRARMQRDGELCWHNYVAGVLWALVPPDGVDPVRRAVRSAFQTAGYAALTTFVSLASAGARRALPAGGPG